MSLHGSSQETLVQSEIHGISCFPYGDAITFLKSTQALDFGVFMFNKKHFSFGRVAALASLVLLVSFGFISCQPKAEYPGYVQVGNVKAYDLKADDPICGEWNGAYGLLLYSTPDFVWATAASGKKLEASADGCITLKLMNYSTSKEEDNYFAKSTSPAYAVYKTDDKKSGVLLFVAEESPYGTPAVGKWYGVKFQIDAADSKKALIEGAFGADYNNISTLAEAVEKFAFDNTECFSEASWTEAYSGATKK